MSPFVSEQTERLLTEFIGRELAPGAQPAQLAAHQPLFEAVLDSANILDLVVFVEERFGISVGDLEITPANFGSLGRLTAFIARKRQAAESEPRRGASAA